MSISETVSDSDYDVTGAVDLHVHCGPEGIPRRFDAVSLARHVEQSGLGGAVLKSHMAATGSWAQMAHDVTGIRLHGSVVLNHYVGGINPAAVRGALGPSAGGEPYLKVVWLPTVHAAAHLTARHHEGEQYDIPPEWCGGSVSSLARPISEVEPINVLATGLRPALDDVLRLAADHNLVLATGHAGRDEVFYVMERGQCLGCPEGHRHPPVLRSPGHRRYGACRAGQRGGLHRAELHPGGHGPGCRSPRPRLSSGRWARAGRSCQRTWVRWTGWLPPKDWPSSAPGCSPRGSRARTSRPR